MPLRYLLRLRNVGRRWPQPLELGPRLRGLVYTCLGEGGAVPGLHDDPRPGPFSISPLSRRGPVMELEVALLNDELGALFARGARRVREQRELLRLGGHRLEWLATEPLDRRESYEELWEAPCDGRTLRLRLLSPTAVHVVPVRIPISFRKVQPLPDPLLYYRGWLRRWNLFAPASLRYPDMEALLDIVEGYLGISHCSGSTPTVSLPARRGIRTFVGFRGTVSFRLLHREDLEPLAVRLLVALARFASYSGTGTGTACGLGATRFKLSGHDPDQAPD